MNRDRAFNLKQRKLHIARRKRIVREVYGIPNYYKYNGAYSKGKIHCSCWVCRQKSRDNLKASERRKLQYEVEDGDYVNI